MDSPALRLPLTMAALFLAVRGANAEPGYPAGTTDSTPATAVGAAEAEASDRDPFAAPRSAPVEQIQARIREGLSAPSSLAAIVLEARWETVGSRLGESSRVVAIDGLGRVTTQETDVPVLSCAPVSQLAVRRLAKLALEVDPSADVVPVAVTVRSGDLVADFRFGDAARHLAWEFEQVAFGDACGPPGWMQGDTRCWALRSDRALASTDTPPAVCEPTSESQRPCWGTGAHGADASFSWRHTDCPAATDSHDIETEEAEAPPGPPGPPGPPWGEMGDFPVYGEPYYIPPPATTP